MGYGLNKSQLRDMVNSTNEGIDRILLNDLIWPINYITPLIDRNTNNTGNMLISDIF